MNLMTEKKTMLSLKDLLEHIDYCCCIGDPESCGEIAQVTCDSREAAGGTLFVAVRGYNTDGHRYIDASVKAGADAVICEEFPGTILPSCFYIKVADSRIALAQSAKAFYGDASDRLRIIGVTGTNGKTTTARLITTMLNANGISAGYIGTNLCRIGERETVIDRTTPEAHGLHAMFRQMVDSGCSAAVMEVSSHALVLERVHGVSFQVGVFTNLTPEHLDFHETMGRYAEAKQKLFGQLRPDGVAVVNADDAAAAAMAAKLPMEKVYCCSINGTQLSCPPQNSFSAEVKGMGVEGSRVLIGFPDGSRQMTIGLPGIFNVMNALEACAAGVAMGLDPSSVISGLESMDSVEGRMQRIWDTGRRRCAIVDYAHTPDALQKTLETLVQIKPGNSRLLVVFGCGGNRDRLKRPEMGRIASEYADIVIITSDNPRDEDPEKILDEIEQGMPGKRFRRISDRAEAIRTAVSELDEGDLLLVAGKGHEKYQEIKGTKHFFSDQEILRQCLQVKEVI